MQLHHERALVPSARGVVRSALACAYAVSLIHVAVVLAVVTGDPGRTGLIGVAAVGFVAALCLFAAAGVTAYVRNSLLAAAWGYVPGLVWVLASGLWLAEAQTRDEPVGSLGLAALVLVDPFVWVCLALAYTVGVAASRAGGTRAGPTEPTWRRAVPRHVGAHRDVRLPGGAGADTDDADRQEALERLLPIGADLTSAAR